MQSSPQSPVRILVVCTGNRGRSQLAHGWLRHFGGDAVEVSSAGTEPKGVHPLAISVMVEVGIDISGNSSDHISEYLAGEFDVVITVCDNAREACPVLHGARRTIHRAFEDPDGREMGPDESREVFRSVRDEIGLWSEGFVAGLTLERS
jgi:arsenate reductase